MDYPILICTPSLNLPQVKLFHDSLNSLSYLTYKDDKLMIKSEYFVKLVSVFLVFFLLFFNKIFKAIFLH